MVSSKSVPTFRVGAVLITAFALVAACSSSSSDNGSTSKSAATTSGDSSSSASASPSASKSSVPPPPPARPVHVSGFPDGSTVGVGMPIIATFNRRITDGAQFAKNTKVTVNGHAANGGWYFENSDPKSGHRMEAHYRLPNYWPAHAHVHVTFNLKGVSAGKRLAFDGKLTSLDFHTGARHIAVVDGSQHQMTVTSDGQRYGVFPVSLGADNTPTFHGTKVIMEQLPTVCMHDTNGTYYECGIKWDQRLTYSGEYLHSAPWNVHNIGHTDTSNGCTNLLPSDAIKLYHFLRIGDVVEYPNANGPAMTMGAGYGDWNVPWVGWQTGGAVPVA